MDNKTEENSSYAQAISRNVNIKPGNYKIKKVERRIKIAEYRRQRKFLRQEGYRIEIVYPEKISDPEALGMSPKRITVSTAGVAKMIKQLGDDQVKFKFDL